MILGFISQFFLPVALFVIMLNVGMFLSFKDFYQVLIQPKIVFLAMLAQLLFLPLLGLWIVLLFELPLLLAAGLVVLTLAPGGATSNAITLFAKGDTALSVSLTVLNSLIVPFTLPLLAMLIFQHLAMDFEQVELPVFQVIVQMLVISMLPICLGVLFGYSCPELNRRIRHVIRNLSLLLMLITVIFLVITSWSQLVEVLPRLALPTMTLVIAAMTLGYYFARLFNMSTPQQIAISVEVGLQNAAVALFVTSSILKSEEMSASVLVYGVLMQIPALLFVLWRNSGFLLRTLACRKVSS